VLSPAQMNELAVSKPALHSKLAAAHRTGTVPKLTSSEKRYVAGLTQSNISQIKAGDGVWIVVVVAAVVVALWLLFWWPWAVARR
jgi:hypothetical protein